MNEWAYTREGLHYSLSLQSPTGGPDFERVEAWCLDVLERLPRDAVDQLFDRRLAVFWCDPEASFAEQQYSPGGEETTDFVILAGNLPRYEAEVARGVIVHEFAHVVCRHDTGGDAAEQEADELARAWGFGKEIEVLRKSAGRARRRPQA